MVNNLAKLVAYNQSAEQVEIGYNCFYSEDNFTPEDLVNKIRMD